MNAMLASLVIMDTIVVRIVLVTTVISAIVALLVVFVIRATTIIATIAFSICSKSTILIVITVIP